MQWKRTSSKKSHLQLESLAWFCRLTSRCALSKQGNHVMSLRKINCSYVLQFLYQSLHVSDFVSDHMSTDCFLAGSLQFPIRCGTDPPGVLQGNPGRQGLGTVVEEIHLQNNFPTRWSCSRVFQVAQLSGATGIAAGVARSSGGWSAPRHAAAAGGQSGLLLDQRVLTTSTQDDTRLLPFSYSCLCFLFCCAIYAAVSLPLSFYFLAPCRHGLFVSVTNGKTGQQRADTSVNCFVEAI